jgi:putative methionine-R-sulfoxide reductase with GAF domain
MRLRVLIATHRMGWRSGSETHTRDLASGLAARGHACAVYAPELRDDGDVNGLRATGIVVTDRLSGIPWKPDIIHGHHRWETVRACVRFPAAAAIQVCHDATNRRDLPAPSTFVRLHCGVDDFCRERVAADSRLPIDAIGLLPNAVDLAAFPARRVAAAYPPRNALIFHSGSDPEDGFGPVVAACADLGIDVQRVGPGRFSQSPGDVLGSFDLVFAKARCALEAMACGCHVILVGHLGVGPTVTGANFAELRRRNFGRSLLREPLDKATVAERIRALAPDTTLEIHRLVRQSCGVDTLAQTAEQLHLRALAAARPSASWLKPAWGALSWVRTEFCRIRNRRRTRPTPGSTTGQSERQPMPPPLASILAELGCQTGTIHRTGVDGQLRLEAQVGVPEFLIPKIAIIPFGKGIAGCAAERKGPVQLCNLQTDTSGVARPEAKATGVNGSLAVPVLAADGRVLGVIGIGKLVPHDFSAEETARLEARARDLAAAWSA